MRIAVGVSGVVLCCLLMAALLSWLSHYPVRELQTEARIGLNQISMLMRAYVARHGAVPAYSGDAVGAPIGFQVLGAEPKYRYVLVSDPGYPGGPAWAAAAVSLHRVAGQLHDVQRMTANNRLCAVFDAAAASAMIPALVAALNPMPCPEKSDGIGSDWRPSLTPADGLER